MTDYHAIAARLILPDKVLIDGKRIAAKSGATFDTINPANSALLAKLPACSAADVDAAVASARTAHEAGVWPVFTRPSASPYCASWPI